MATIANEDNPFTLVPRSLSRSSNISPGAKAVYLRAASLCEGEKLTTEFFADQLGMSDYDVHEYVDELNEHGYMKLAVVDNEP